MNTANLQLEGLLIAVAELSRLLVRKGLVEASEVEQALATAEASLRADLPRMGQLSGSNVEAVCFPIRFLSAALRAKGGAPLAFSELACQVGQSKPSRPTPLPRPLL
ncbi:hypothetical protein DWF00_22460 [Bosea caraganae]|uniref:Uncharacterized protein n=1 Tax=Bosea caraganae TaxID=2763117 RepID=A0A370L1E9_9HYPH|nr:hypothetical protein [Bosea caraganae]RDJ21424.1 hypothetical protein DWE98_20525 [Bosea caraganae]RDJ23392.1 hypothetical protein DWF00_22460 [Bosea caraganae]